MNHKGLLPQRPTDSSSASALVLDTPFDSHQQSEQEADSWPRAGVDPVMISDDL